MRQTGPQFDIVLGTKCTVVREAEMFFPPSPHLFFIVIATVIQPSLLVLNLGRDALCSLRL